MLFMLSWELLIRLSMLCFVLFFFNDTATTEIYTLSLHDALPISYTCGACEPPRLPGDSSASQRTEPLHRCLRSEEHTSELQSRPHLVCRLLLEKKKKKKNKTQTVTKTIKDKIRT